MRIAPSVTVKSRYAIEITAKGMSDEGFAAGAGSDILCERRRQAREARKKSAAETQKERRRQASPSEPGVSQLVAFEARRLTKHPAIHPAITSAKEPMRVGAACQLLGGSAFRS